MNWTQPKSFVKDNQNTINFKGNKLLKGVWVKWGKGREGGGEGDNDAHI